MISDTDLQKPSSPSEPSRRPARRLPPIRKEQLFNAIPFLLVIWISSLATLKPLDFWWHLKSGQIILESGSIPATDIFSYTASGTEYLLQNWLSEAIFYLLYKAGGPPLVVFFNTLVLLATVFPLYLLCKHRSRGAGPAVVAALMTAIPLVLHAVIRPQVFSFLFFAWFFFLLMEFRSRRRNLVWFLPVLMVPWANLHGAFILGMGLVALFLALDLGMRLFERQDVFTRREVKTLLLVLTLTVAATFVNPFGLHVYDYVRATIWSPAALEYVVEWKPPVITTFGDMVRFFALFFVTIFFLIRSKIRPDVRDLGILFAFAVLALTARRNGAWFAIVAGPLVAPYLDFGSRAGAEPEAGSRSRLNLFVAAILLCFTILGLPWMQQVLSSRNADRMFLDASLPIGAANFISEGGIQGRIFHPQEYGDYLIWRLWPKQKTFIDGRVPVFSLNVARDYHTILAGAGGWEEVAGKYQVEYLLLDRKAENQKQLIEAAGKGGTWSVLYQDDQSVLFGKRR